MCAPALMSHPTPIRRPPEPSMIVKGPIQVPSPISGAPTTSACGLYGLCGMPSIVSSAIGLAASGDYVGDDFAEPFFDADLRAEAEHFGRTPRVGSAPRDEHIAWPELWLDVDTDGVDQQASEIGNRRLLAGADVADRFALLTLE